MPFPEKKKKDSMILILKVFYQEFKKFYKDSDESKILLSYWNSGLAAKFFSKSDSWVVPFNIVEQERQILIFCS